MKTKAPDPVPGGFIGVELSEKGKVVSIDAVLEKSPAHEAGLKKGDRIEQINGQMVASIADARHHLAQVGIGQPSNRSSRALMSFSSPSTSTSLSLLVAPRTNVTAERRTPNSAATAVRTAFVACPSTARAATATTSAGPDGPSYRPPTAVLDAPGRTRSRILIPEFLLHHRLTIRSHLVRRRTLTTANRKAVMGPSPRSRRKNSP